MDKTFEEYGTPYSLEEARIALTKDKYIDEYHRELMSWLCDEVERLEKENGDVKVACSQFRDKLDSATRSLNKAHRDNYESVNLSEEE